jgi:hypothetical protein
MRSTNEAIPRVPPGLEAELSRSTSIGCQVPCFLIAWSARYRCVVTGQRWQGLIYNDDGFPSRLCSPSPSTITSSRPSLLPNLLPVLANRHATYYLSQEPSLLTVVNTYITMCFSTEPRTKYYYREEIIPAPRRHYHHHGHGHHHHHHHHSPRVSYSSVTRRSYHSPRISASSHKAY